LELWEKGETGIVWEKGVFYMNHGRKERDGFDRGEKSLGKNNPSRAFTKGA